MIILIIPQLIIKQLGHFFIYKYLITIILPLKLFENVRFFCNFQHQNKIATP